MLKIRDYTYINITLASTTKQQALLYGNVGRILIIFQNTRRHTLPYVDNGGLFLPLQFEFGTKVHWYSFDLPGCLRMWPIGLHTLHNLTLGIPYTDFRGRLPPQPSLRQSCFVVWLVSQAAGGCSLQACITW